MLDEYRIIRNPALGALALWEFVQAFVLETGQESGPAVPLAVPVLAMVFHEHTVNLIARRQFVGGIFRVARDDRALAAGLQARTEAMAPLAFESLDLAFKSGLLTLDRRKFELGLGTVRYIRSDETAPTATRPMLNAAKRIGHWFAGVHPNQIFDLLGLYF